MSRRRGTLLRVVTAGWQAPAEAVQAALEREQVPAALGPSSGGWTPVRLLVEDQDVLEPRGRDLADLVDDLARSLSAPGVTCLVGDAGARLLLACPGGARPASAELPPLGAAEGPGRADWSAVLGALGRLDVLGAVLEAAAPGPAGRPSVAALVADRRALDVGALLGLPAVLLDPDVLDDAEPFREAVVARGLPAAEVALAAGHTGGPLLLAATGETSSVVPGEPDGLALLPAAVQLAPLRTPVLLLWRRGRSRSWLLVRRAKVEHAHTWSDAWHAVALDPTLDAETREELTEALLPPTGDAALLAERLGTSATDVVALRTLLRRPPGPECLPDLCGALGLDPAAALVVEAAGTASLPGSRALQPSSGVGAVWAAATAPRAGDPWYITMSQRKPWWYRSADVVFAILAAVWALALWDGGGTGARIGAAALVLLAVGSVVDAVTPGWGRGASRL